MLEHEQEIYLKMARQKEKEILDVYKKVRKQLDFVRK